MHAASYVCTLPYTYGCKLPYTYASCLVRMQVDLYVCKLPCTYASCLIRLQAALYVCVQAALYVCTLPYTYGCKLPHTYASCLVRMRASCLVRMQAAYSLPKTWPAPGIELLLVNVVLCVRLLLLCACCTQIADGLLLRNCFFDLEPGERHACGSGQTHKFTRGGTLGKSQNMLLFA